MIEQLQELILQDQDSQVMSNCMSVLEQVLKFLTQDSSPWFLLLFGNACEGLQWVSKPSSSLWPVDVIVVWSQLGSCVPDARLSLTF